MVWGADTGLTMALVGLKSIFAQKFRILAQRQEPNVSLNHFKSDRGAGSHGATAC